MCNRINFHSKTNLVDVPVHHHNILSFFKFILNSQSVYKTYKDGCLKVCNLTASPACCVLYTQPNKICNIGKSAKGAIQSARATYPVQLHRLGLLFRLNQTRAHLKCPLSAPACVTNFNRLRIRSIILLKLFMTLHKSSARIESEFCQFTLYG